MRFWRRFVASSLMTLLTFSCSNAANPQGEYTQQVVQESNVAQLLTEGHTCFPSSRIFESLYICQSKTH